MNTNLFDTCHCIVRHPDKPKFLVVKHEEDWLPPVFKFPPGVIDSDAALVNQSMKEKYGLKSRVLRTVLRMPNYHCLELELANIESSKKLKAVWVDQEEYLHSRTPTDDAVDPYEIWFEEQKAGQVPAQRPPFQQPGWFTQADHWIYFQLDRLGIQVTGSVEQYRQGLDLMCLLRVPTNQGWIYLKTSLDAAPGEAALTAALASKFPQLLVPPLASDAGRNWLLAKEANLPGAGVDVAALPEFARLLAELQLGSSECLEEWQALGCRELTLDDLTVFCTNPEPYRKVLQDGGGGLTDQEWAALPEILQTASTGCQVLASAGLPAALVPAHFEPRSLAMDDGQHYLLDWRGTVISHPFLALGHIFRGKQSVLGAASTRLSLGNEQYQQVIHSYLQAFTGHASQEVLLTAMEAARQLEPVWSLLNRIHLLARIEPKTPYFFRQAFTLQNDLKKHIRQQMVERSLADGLLTD